MIKLDFQTPLLSSVYFLPFSLSPASRVNDVLWKWPPIVFVIYRLLLAFFTVGSLSAFIAKNIFLPHHLMAYMTSWSYILLALHFNFSAIIVVYRFCRSICLPDERDPEDNDTLKSDSSSSCSPSHTIYPHMSSRNTFEDISVHGINSVLVIFEMIVSAYPVRLLHALYTIIFGLLYIIFTLIYWSQAPLENIIYRGMLDWNRPKNALILSFVLLFLVVPFLQTFFFLLYKCRLRCYRSLYNENYTT
ncbi:unnamed protein product [Acanthosepion pharaonis]|uniref:Transmembrane protein n=1 Tax=Acanthosepion pharaonis TaxID=158019 RepID=A0A812BDQ4_ACAPH|nr:unnamed protein product [Sepia pharaonis]